MLLLCWLCMVFYAEQGVKITIASPGQNADIWNSPSQDKARTLRERVTLSTATQKSLDRKKYMKYVGKR